MKHTQGKWRITSKFNIENDKERLVANTGGYQSNQEDVSIENEANAEFIVKACNNHYQLLEALKGIIEIGKRDLSNPKYDDYFREAEQAISEAEGDK